MKALIYNGPRDVRIQDVPDAKIEQPTDVLVKITTTNICGSDLHMGTGQCNVKACNRYLRNLIHTGRANPSWIISHELSLEEAPDAYKNFDSRERGWTKVILHPQQSRTRNRARSASVRKGQSEVTHAE